MGSLSLLQGIFLTQGSNPGLLHCRQILYQLSYEGSFKVKVSRTIMSYSTIPWTAAYQAPPSMGFARQEYWSGVPSSYPLQYSLASLVIQLVKNPPALRNTWVRSWVGKIPWRREWLPTPVLWPGEFHGLYSPWGRRVGRD